RARLARLPSPGRSDIADPRSARRARRAAGRQQPRRPPSERPSRGDEMTAIGDPAPTFALSDTTGAVHEPGDAPATVVVFTCNHCPYALAWHDRIVTLAHDYADRGVRVLAINSNDAERYPRDSMQAMHARVQRGEFDGVPYLR